MSDAQDHEAVDRPAPDAPAEEWADYYTEVQFKHLEDRVATLTAQLSSVTEQRDRYERPGDLTVERVARAIQASEEGNHREDFRVRWEDETDAMRDWYRESARAALAAVQVSNSSESASDSSQKERETPNAID